MIIHETSIVHPSSKIDDSVEIGPFCIVGENVEIKKDTKLLSHVVIKGPTSIGANNIFINFQQLVMTLLIKNLKERKQNLKLEIIIFLGKG